MAKHHLHINVIAAFAVLFATAHSFAQNGSYAQSVLLNNRGVGQMSQQFAEKAAEAFAAAMKADPQLAQPAINEGIALLELQKIDAAKDALKRAIAVDPKSPQAWYNLGLAQHAGNELDPALASFQQAAALDPEDADSFYFEGVCYAELKQFDQAIAAFNKALAVNPLHASSEFALARALQRSGHPKDEVAQHFKQKRFERLVGAVDLVDQQHRRAGVVGLERLQERPLDQEAFGEHVAFEPLPIKRALGLCGADRDHLRGVVPLVNRG